MATSGAALSPAWDVLTRNSGMSKSGVTDSRTRRSSGSERTASDPAELPPARVRGVRFPRVSTARTTPIVKPHFLFTERRRLRGPLTGGGQSGRTDDRPKTEGLLPD